MKNKVHFDGSVKYHQGDIFFPGAPSLVPVDSFPLPLYRALGTGYINAGQLPVVQGRAMVQSQQATPIGLGVQAGTSFVLQPLIQDNAISQAS
jgi:hypothetical protein